MAKGPGFDEQFTAIYEKLRPLAVSLLWRSRIGTLTPTALISEACIKLLESNQQLKFESPTHLKRMVVKVMKEVLVDAWRRKNTKKRGEGAVKITLDDQLEAKEWTIERLMIFNDALDQLRVLDARKADVVECRFYLELSDQEIATELAISVATVRRDWDFARAWLNKHFSE